MAPDFYLIAILLSFLGAITVWFFLFMIPWWIISYLQRRKENKESYKKLITPSKRGKND